jgi:hypothetical protein
LCLHRKKRREGERGRGREGEKQRGREEEEDRERERERVGNNNKNLKVPPGRFTEEVEDEVADLIGVALLCARLLHTAHSPHMS